MAPHAIETGSIGSKTSVSSNPFESTIDPYLLSSNYISPITIINQAIFSTQSKIFSYETICDVEFDNYLNNWITNYQRINGFNEKPEFYKFQIRSGAGNNLLGYLDNDKSGVSVIGDGNGLKYMYPALSQNKLPIALNVSAIDYNNDLLVSNYEKVLSSARSLNYPVLTATNHHDGKELQFLTLLNQYLSLLTNNVSINLFEGLESTNFFTKYDNLLSVEDLASTFKNLQFNDESGDLNETVTFAIEKLNQSLNTDYSNFKYIGNPRPSTVFVVYGTNESTKLGEVFEKLTDYYKVGLIQVRIPIPFNFNEFIKLVPKTTEKLVVLSPNSGTNTSIKADISSSLFLNGMYNRYDINEYVYELNFNWTPITIVKLLSQYVEIDEKIVLKDNVDIDYPINTNSSPIGQYVIWGKDNGEFFETANKLAFTLSLDDSKKVSIRNKFDNLTKGGIFQSQINSTDGINEIDSSDLTIVEDIDYFNHYDIISTTKPGSTILIGNYAKFDDSKLLSQLSKTTKESLLANENEIIVIDFSIFEDLKELNDSTKGFSNEFLIQFGFWKQTFPQLDSLIVNKLIQGNGAGFELLAAVVDKFITEVEAKGGLKPLKVVIETEEKDKEQDEEQQVLPFFINETSYYPNPRNSNEIDLEEATTGGYLDLAKKLTFNESFNTKTALRPDLPVNNFIVKVQKNIRLTPDEYSRNIFHIEFDISGTGLTYDIGEALGIHGRNHPEDVEEFLQFYGVDGDSIVELINKDDPSLVEIKTARQSLLDTVDFLGKPPKRFYESLAEYATEENDKAKLTKLAGAEGAEELKKRQEVDFSTYFDILEEFKSAKPPFAELVKIIAPLKRREYSIASSQKLHPNALHLLIVVVDWTDSKGRKRWGHCSKYLSDLNIGDELVVSVKKSVMKLPPLSTQPIIMSGLGTGLAPFKAFIEERIWQKEQGMEIGEIYLFMGSRHKKEEYLYGELWEAYKKAGVLTHIGAAFSRDQPEKIYIQDKIRESLSELTDAMITKNGSFYLCGPTWPVPDITACLEDIIINAAAKNGETIKDVNKVVEDMKESGRYILEVY